MLNVRGTGRHEKIPEADIDGTHLPGGWYMVVSNHDGLELLDNYPQLRQLSEQAEVICCFVEEHVMFSAASYWKNGQQVWSVRHDAQKGIEHLDMEGDLPPFFAKVRDEQRSKQITAGGNTAGVDYIFEIPVKLAESTTGYRHDISIPELAEFEILESIQAPPVLKAWWKKLTRR